MIGKKKQGFSSRKQSDEMALQITSMADIFTIILVFLLKSYATSALNITPTAGLLLPEAQAADTQVEALKLEIANDSVNVEGKPATPLKNFAFDKADLLGNGSSKGVNAALETEKKRQLLIAKANADVKVDSKILIVADQKTPYSTVKSVLASAAINGFTDFKLVVVRKDGQ
jgi:biopolymer transport protein ExbD